MWPSLPSSFVWLGGSHAQASPTTTTTYKIPAGTVLNVGDQEQFLESALQDSGALKGAHYKVNFVEFDSGPLVNAGFAAHQIDLGFMGDLPAALAVQSGLPVKAVVAMLPIGASEFLLAKPGITSISQLKGQTVGVHDGHRRAGLRPARARNRRAHAKGRDAGERGARPTRHRAADWRRRWRRS